MIQDGTPFYHTCNPQRKFSSILYVMTRLGPTVLVSEVNNRFTLYSSLAVFDIRCPPKNKVPSVLDEVV